MAKAAKKGAKSKNSPKSTKKSERSRGIKKFEVLIHGASGRMGQELIRILENHPTLTLAATVTEREITAIDAEHTAVLKYSPKALAAVIQGADVIIDFSAPAGTATLAKCLHSAENKIVLIGTTGLTKPVISQFEKSARTGRHKILLAGNTSLGVATLAKLAALAAEALAPAGFDIEITETHHRMKVDAPSGTAILLADMLREKLSGTQVTLHRDGKRKPNTIGIHSVRGGGVVGEHEVRFISDFEEVRLTHRAFNRSLFAHGALNMIAAIERGVTAGQVISLKDFLLQ